MIFNVCLCSKDLHFHKDVKHYLQSDDISFTARKSGKLEALMARMPMDMVIVDENFLEKIADMERIYQLLDEKCYFLIIARSAAMLSFLKKAEAERLMFLYYDPDNILEQISFHIHNCLRVEERLMGVEVSGEPSITDFVSNSPSMRTLLSMVKKVVRAKSSLLILGETGVGKERLARAIHNEGPRKDAPFISINCAALPDQLLESELFGHEKGAFTGADRARRGAFEMAHGGTIFLDEIGDMPMRLQAKLLHVLQDKTVKKLGSESNVTVDVRIVAATNCDLKYLIEHKEFRKDLYYRLSVLTLTIPPLSERKEDIPEIVRRFLRKQCNDTGIENVEISDDAIKALQKYDWPGNVRELLNVLERGFLLCEDDIIQLTDLPDELYPSGFLSTDSGSGILRFPDELIEQDWKSFRKKMMGQVEKLYFEQLLEKYQGKINLTAEHAGMDPRSLYEKLKRNGIKKEQFK